MIRRSMILAISLLASPVFGADDAGRFAGEWQTTRGPLTLEAKANELTGRLVFWRLPVKGQVKDGQLALGYDEGQVHYDATLEVDPSSRRSPEWLWRTTAIVESGTVGGSTNPPRRALPPTSPGFG